MNAALHSTLTGAHSTVVKLNYPALEDDLTAGARLSKALWFSIMGLQASGFEPTKDDLAALEELSARVAEHTAKADCTFQAAFGGAK